MGSRANSSSVSGRWRVYVGTFLLIGLATFFAPLITANPAVSGKSSWSLQQIVLRSRAVPNDVNLLNFWKIDFGVFYFVMVVALMSVCVFPSRKLVVTLGALNALFSRSLWGLTTKRDLDLILYGRSIGEASFFPVGKGASARPLILVLDAIMLILIAIVWADNAE